MEKYAVVVQFAIKALDRHEAWREAREVCRKHLRDLATVHSVSSQPLPDPDEWIAVNEPIQARG